MERLPKKATTRRNQREKNQCKLCDIVCGYRSAVSTMHIHVFVVYCRFKGCDHNIEARMDL